MQLTTIDFETYYDQDYSLSKMTTEAYVRDPRFEIIGVSVKDGDAPAVWYSGSDPEGFLKSLDYTDRAILCHNTAFDGAILSWRMGIKPKLWLDTMSMARPKHAMTCGVSLKALAQHYGLQEKGTEVLQAKGKRRADFTPAEMSAYGGYCIGDAEITYELFKRLNKGFPVSELLMIDQVLRMYTEPTIVLDRSLLDLHYERVLARKQALIDTLGGAEGVRTYIMSNNMFAKLLEARGVEPPTKTSAKTGKQSYAFAKTDLDFLDLQEHEDPVVQTLVTTRLGLKSTLEETRTQRLIGVSERGALPIMLNYYGGHTGRLSGGDKLNLQNLPARGDNTLRRAIKAPPGHKLISCDASQIEARVVAYISDQADLVQAFREGRDVYSEFATEVYGRAITKADKAERFAGKTCLASGTRVLTRRGWVRIVDVQQSDQLWDGEEWVQHQGVSFMGVKQTISLSGVELTASHEILTAPTNWVPALAALQSPGVFQSALSTATLPSLATRRTDQGQGSRGGGDQFAGALAVAQNIHTMQDRYGQDAQQPAILALNERPQTNAGGNTRLPSQTTCTGQDYSIGCLPQSVAVIPPRTGCTATMASGGYLYARSGETTEQRSCGMCKPYPVGMSLREIWIASTMTEGTSPAISGSLPKAKTRATNDPSLYWKPVYDILNSGSRNRFTVLTDAGPLIVHNCILGLGFQTGASKLKNTLKRGQGGVNVVVSDDEAESMVQLYRRKNHKIVGFWGACGYALTSMLAGRSGTLGNILSYTPEGIRLPNGMLIRYPGLAREGHQFTYVYDERMYQRWKRLGIEPEEGAQPNGVTNIYGGKVTENCVQAVARIVTSEHMGLIRQAGYHVAFQVHDENIAVVPDAKVEQAMADIKRIMSTPPTWAPDLPVACEIGVGDNFGDA